MSLRRQSRLGGAEAWINMPLLRHTDSEKLSIHDINQMMEDIRLEVLKYNYRKLLTPASEMEWAYSDLSKTSGALPSIHMHKYIDRNKNE